MRRDRRRDRPVKRPTFRPEPLPGRPPWGTHWGIRCSLLLWLDRDELLIERLLPERNAEMVDVTAAVGREGDAGGGGGIPLDTGTGTQRELRGDGTRARRGRPVTSSPVRPARYAGRTRSQNPAAAGATFSAVSRL